MARAGFLDGRRLQSGIAFQSGQPARPSRNGFGSGAGIGNVEIKHTDTTTRAGWPGAFGAVGAGAGVGVGVGGVVGRGRGRATSRNFVLAASASHMAAIAARIRTRARNHH